MALAHIESQRPAELLMGPKHRCEALGSFSAPRVVICTQSLARVSPLVPALTRAGYEVTIYPSATRLLPRLARLPLPIHLLVIDGSNDVPFARSALVRARAAFANLPILLLSHSETELGDEATRFAARVLHWPLVEHELVRSARALAPSVHD